MYIKRRIIYFDLFRKIPFVFLSRNLSFYAIPLLCLLIASCSSEVVIHKESNDLASDPPLDKNYIEDASIQEQLNYKEYHLTSLMEHILDVNPGFEKLTEFKAGKRKRPAVYMSGLLDGFYPSGKDEEHLSLEAFTDLDGETWYPILTRIKEGERHAENALYLINSFDPDTESEYVKAYHLNEEGELILVDGHFAEDEFLSMSQKSTLEESVYTLSIVSCAPIEGIKKIAYTDCYSGGGTGSGGYTPPSTLRIEKIEINDKKESWIEKADIEFQGVKVSFDGSQFVRDYSIGFSSSYLNLTGSRKAVTKISNSDIGSFQTVNFKIGSESSNSSFVFTVYEYDSWPAPKKYIQTSLLPASCDCARPNYNLFGYRSYQTPYFNRVYSINRNASTDGIPYAFGRTISNPEDNYSGRIKFTNSG